VLVVAGDFEIQRDVEAGDSGHAARLPAAKGDESEGDQDEEDDPDQHTQDAEGRLIDKRVHEFLCGRLLVGISIGHVQQPAVPRPDLLLLLLLSGLGLLKALSLLERHRCETIELRGDLRGAYA
jgi:hypothetical protein